MNDEEKNIKYNVIKDDDKTEKYNDFLSNKKNYDDYINGIVYNSVYNNRDLYSFFKNEFDIKVFFGLYRNYLVFKKIEDDTERIKKMKEYENKIYIINKKTIKEQTRILIELSKIENIYQKNKDKFKENGHLIDKKLNSIYEILKMDSKYSSELLTYIKKNIVDLQITLEMDITFYDAAYNSFLETFRNMEEHYKKKKEGRKYNYGKSK